MLFNSFSFLVFFPIVTILYFALPQRFRWALLLLASCVFYMAFIPYYILILFTTILIDYYAGIKIEQATNLSKRKAFLILSIVSTVLVLAIFKYFNFLEINVGALASFLHWNYSPTLLNIILPIGLSFHTFQSLSYVIEVYKGKQKAEKNFGIYSLYVMFYPQLVAGPIERPQNLIHQFYEKHVFDYQRITFGLQRMLWGFFKKVVVADNLAFYVDKVYGVSHQYTGITLLVATAFFAFQIYCDFSGYSDIAIGSAQVMGFKLMDNFKNPYFSKSVQEFWSRWHISLSTWFRDYVYIPLGGNRTRTYRWSFNIIITFLISGLWHGANWTYVIWGLIHGVYLAIYSLFKKFYGVLPTPNASFFTNFFKSIATFFLVLIAWIFFRAKTLSESLYVLEQSLRGFVAFIKALALSIAHLNFAPLNEIAIQISKPLPSLIYLWAYIGVVISFVLLDFIDNKHGIVNFVRARKPWLRWLIYFVAILSIMNLGVTRETPFIYYQF
jgi:D-alanyl-lipoteichoic acid acyltransferase DltB (MBOAT superfamily)